MFCSVNAENQKRILRRESVNLPSLDEYGLETCPQSRHIHWKCKIPGDDIPLQLHVNSCMGEYQAHFLLGMTGISLSLNRRSSMRSCPTRSRLRLALATYHSCS